MSRELTRRFLQFIRTENMFTDADPVLLAVSGGIDSMVMAKLFSEADLKFGIAHVNFQLRAEESDEDENFVRATAEALGAPFYTARFETEKVAKHKKISIQMAARELRYTWLEKIRKENGYHRIATAHHIDDTIETVLMNMIRGTGIRGLQGIPSINEKIVRPLLCFYKDELKAFAAEKQLSFREDSSNQLVDYDRNKIRLSVIPAIEKDFPSFKKTFSGNISKWKDASELFELSMNRIKKKLLVKRDDETWISVPALQLLPAKRTILFELLKDFGFVPEQMDDINSALAGESGKMFLSSTHRLVKDRKHLIISPLSSEGVSEMLILEGDRQISAGNLAISISEKNASSFNIPADPKFSCLDKKELEFPLVLRRWKKGDYFYPLGMKMKKKKISDYLIDRKIPLNEKENIWVVESGQRIACIIGERIDHRFRIKSGTIDVLVIERK